MTAWQLIQRLSDVHPDTPVTVSDFDPNGSGLANTRHTVMVYHVLAPREEKPMEVSIVAGRPRVKP